MDVTPRIVGICENLGIITSAYTTIVPKDNVCERFYYYFFLHQDYNKSLKAQGTGVRTTLTNTQFGAVKIPIPPYQEQIQIANYLDTQSQKINHFIAKKQQFIALLKEQRQSVINEKLKINAKKIKIKYCVSKVGTGVTPTGGATVYKDSGIIFLRSQNVHNDGLRLDDVAYITEEIHSEMKGSQVQFDDVLVNVTGASIGRCFVFDKMEEANINQHVCILRPNQDVLLSEFLMLQIQSERIQTLINMIEGASREGLTNNELKNYYLFVPSLKDQKNIITEIKTETATIDTAIAKTEKEIELIKEYKEAMIAEAVMGKVNFNKTVNAQ
jgi:type I restriction enzyme S subunit